MVQVNACCKRAGSLDQPYYSVHGLNDDAGTLESPEPAKTRTFSYLLTKQWFDKDILFRTG